MKQALLCTEKEHPELDQLTQLLSAGRYFRRLSPDILRTIIKQGSLVSFVKDEQLIQEGDESSTEMYILVEGSLAILANDRFILRLDDAGDVVGEMAVIQSAPRSATVIAETDCRLVMFPSHLFAIDRNAAQASIIYLLFSHILSAKLRITTAQSLVHKNQRVSGQGKTTVGIIDAHTDDRRMTRSAVAQCWPEAQVFEFDSPPEFVDQHATQRFDLIIADVDFFSDIRRDWNWTSTFIKAMKLRGAHTIILSESCHNADDRELLIKMGVDELMPKPCQAFDLQHTITRVRNWYYKNLELDKAESEADTDKLTGLANRRRLDHFLDAMTTVYADDKRSFSLIIVDVDNFKHYNDTHGHQMGDVVLQEVAALMANNVRRGDLAARYGGEEFVAILPDCGKQRALQLAESLRAVVEQAPFAASTPTTDTPITITLGVATFPDDAASPDDLLQQADQCLYLGKQKGKNRVIAAGPESTAVVPSHTISSQ